MRRKNAFIETVFMCLMCLTISACSARSARSPDPASESSPATEVPNCLQHPQMGVMGFHHINRTLVDDKLDVKHPEVLPTREVRVV
jgi:hypothetical protein